MNINKSEKKVRDLVNGDSVIVFSEGFAYNTTVEWTLADFMEDEPPFVEVCFNERCEEDTIYYTSDLDRELFCFGGCLIIVEE